MRVDVCYLTLTRRTWQRMFEVVVRCARSTSLTKELCKGGEDVMFTQRVWMPTYVYAYSPWYGYYPALEWQEYEIDY